jgi:hypothetical protein
MNLSPFEADLHDFLHRSNRPLINILSLDFFMKHVNQDGGEYSLMLKTCAFFYLFCINNPAIFALLFNFNGSTLPWNTGSMAERETWIYPSYLEDIGNDTLRERAKLIWFKQLDYWFEVYFQNPYFYLRWTELTGWGWYLRRDVLDIRVVLNSHVMKHNSFVESVQEMDKEYLERLGFKSFFRYNNPGTPSSDLWIVGGFLWFANRDEYSPIWFDHLHDVVDAGEPDSVVGLPYRFIGQWYRIVWTEVSYIY